jgi:hypothetical protein
MNNKSRIIDRINFIREWNSRNTLSLTSSHRWSTNRVSIPFTITRLGVHSQECFEWIIQSDWIARVWRTMKQSPQSHHTGSCDRVIAALKHWKVHWKWENALWRIQLSGKAKSFKIGETQENRPLWCSLPASLLLLFDAAWPTRTPSFVSGHWARNRIHNFTFVDLLRLTLVSDYPVFPTIRNGRLWPA